MSTQQTSSRIFFIVIVVLWLMVPVIDMTARFLLPPSFYTYRAWEFMTTTESPGPFKPSTVFQGRIYGDLANMLHIRKFRRYRQQIFTTDSAGFRNPASPPGTYYPIVVVGDSDMAGSSLSDNQTFAHLLQSKTNLPIYNYAPASILSFLADERFQKNPPKVLIWEAIERTIHANNFRYYASLPPKARFTMNKQTSNKTHLSPPRLSGLLAKDLYHEIIWRLTGGHEDAIGHIDPDSGMLFYQPGIEILQQDAKSRGLQEVVGGIDKIGQLLANRGITLIFIPLPDKEDIYQELLPDHIRPSVTTSLVEQLVFMLHNQGINAIDLCGPFRTTVSTFKQTRQEQDSLYFLDDTHWNSYGVALAAQETANYLNALQHVSSTEIPAGLP